MATIGEFISTFPQFQVKEQAALEMALRMSLIVCPIKSWQKYELTEEEINSLVYLHTAHILTGDFHQTAETAGTSAAIASGSPAPFPASKGENDLDLTFYGQMFKRMRASLIPATGFCL